jgi:hypothetical protein
MEAFEQLIAKPKPWGPELDDFVGGLKYAGHQGRTILLF